MRNLFLFLLLACISLSAQAQLELPFSVKVLNPRPLDAYYFNSSGVPYTNTAQVLSQISASVRYRGQTVNVSGVEYWFEAGTADGDLVIKLGGGSSGPYWLTNANTTLTTDVTIGGGRVTYTPTATKAGFNLGGIPGAPSSLVNGDMWYDNTGNRIRAVTGGVARELINGFVDPDEVAFGVSTGNIATDNEFTYNSTTNQLNVPTLSITSVTGPAAISFNQRTVFTPSATSEGLTVGSIATDPTSPNNSGIWYNTTAQEFRGRINSVTRTIVSTTSAVANRVPFFQAGSPVSGVLDHSSSFGFNSGTGALSAPWFNGTTTASRPALSLGAGITGDPTNTSNFDLWSSTTGPAIRTKLNNTIYNMAVIGATATNRVIYALDGNGRLNSSADLDFTQSGSTYTLSVGTATNLNNGTIRLGTTTGTGKVEIPGAFALSLAGSLGTSGQVLTSNGTTASWETPSGTGDMLLASAQTSTGKKTFQADATNAGLRLGPVTTAPSTLVTGDMWYRSTNNSYHGWVGADVLFPYTTPGTHQANAIMVFAGSGASNEGLFGCNPTFTYTVGDGLSVHKANLTDELAFTGASGSITSAGDLGTVATGVMTFDASDIEFYSGGAEIVLGSTDASITASNDIVIGTASASTTAEFSAGGTGTFADARLLLSTDGSSNGKAAIYTTNVERLGIENDGAWVLGADGTGTAGQVLTSNGASAPPTWEDAGGGSGGDVDGPASATDNAIARFDGTTGKIIQNSGVTISDLGTISAGTIDLNGTSALSLKTASASRISIDNTGGITLHDTPTTDNTGAKVLTRDASTQKVEMMDVQSDRYTPSVSAGAGGSITASGDWHYIRIGTEVTISGFVSFNPSGATTNGTVIFSLPFASNFTGISDLLGSANASNIDPSISVSVFSEGTDDTGRIQFQSETDDEITIRFTAIYEIK